MRLGRSFIATLALAAVAASTSPASADFQHLAGGYLVGSLPTGDWGEIAGFGLALDATDVVKRDTDKWFSVRSSFGVLYNFSRTVDVPAANVGPTDRLTIETKNWSLLFGVGPEFSAPNQTVTPFAFGTVGFDTYWTGSTLSGTATGLPYEAEHGDSRISFAWGAGAGIRREIGTGRMSELSVEYRSGSTHDFLLPTDVNVSGGGVNAHRREHSSDQYLIRFGVVLGN